MLLLLLDLLKKFSFKSLFPIPITSGYQFIDWNCWKVLHTIKDVHGSHLEQTLEFLPVPNDMCWSLLIQWLVVYSKVTDILKKSNSQLANILIFTPEWSAGYKYSLFSQVTVLRITSCICNTRCAFFTNARILIKITAHLRSWKINWYFVGYSQNIWRQNAMHRDELVADVVENIGFQVDFQSVYFYIDYIDFIIK